MARCSKCNETLSYGLVFKSFAFNYRNIECSNCGTVQEPAMRNRYLVALVIVLGLISGAIIADYLVDSAYISSPKWLISMAINLILSFALLFFIIPCMKFEKVDSTK